MNKKSSLIPKKDLQFIETTIAELATASTDLSAMADKFCELETENAELRQLLETFGSAAQFLRFKEKAKTENVSVQEWIIRTCKDACQSKANIKIDVNIYRELEILANAKCISLNEFTTSEEVTESLREILQNRWI